MHWELVYKLMVFFEAKILAILVTNELEIAKWMEENTSLAHYALFVDEDNFEGVLNTLEKVLLCCKVKDPHILKNKTLRSNLVIVMDELEFDPSDIDLAFDSHLITINSENGQITEHYALLGVHYMNVLGFTSGADLEIDQPKFIWKRRNNLHGVTLKNSALLWFAVNDVTNYTDPKGYFPELLQTLQDMMNFTTEWIKPKHYIWGDLDPKTGEWRGIIGEVNSSKAHLGCSGITVTLERSLGADFTFGVLEEIDTLITAKEAAKKTLDSSAFVNVFRTKLWINYFFILLSMTLVVVIHMTRNGSLGASIPISFWAIFNMCLQLDATAPLKSLSWRMAFASAVICNYIVFVMYTCYLTAQLSASSNGLQLHSFQDLLDEQYVLYINYGSLQHSILANSDHKSVKYKVYSNIVKFLANVDICPKTSCRVELLQENAKGAIFESSLTFAHQQGVKIWTTLNGAHSYQLAIALAKDSDLTSLFNYNLIKIYQSGTIERLKYKWMQDSIPGDMSNRIFPDEAVPIGYLNVLFPTVLFAAGTLLCLVFGLLEKIYYKLK